MPGFPVSPLFVIALLAASAAAPPIEHRVMRTQPAPTTLVFPKDSTVVEVPFEVDHNHILIPVSVAGAPPVLCVFDTGARGTVMFGDSLLRAAGMEPTGEALVRGAGGGGAPTRAKFYANVTLGVGGLRLTGGDLVAMPDSATRHLPGRERMATGRGLFEHAVVEIDWDHQVVRFHDPASFHYAGKGAVLPLTFDSGGAPYTTARITLAPDSAFDARLVIDTGASHALSLEAGTHPQIRVPRDGERIRLGRGASGDVFGVTGSAARVEFGGVTFKDVPVAFPDSSLGVPREAGRQGNLGSGLLKRFRVWFDYASRRMMLEPGAQLRDPFTKPGS